MSAMDCNVDYSRRYEVTQNEKPYNYICHLYVKRRFGGVFPSTGFLIADDVILTSGHSIGEPLKPWLGRNRVQSVRIVLFEYFDNSKNYQTALDTTLFASQLDSYGSHPGYKGLRTREKDYGYIKLKSDFLGKRAGGYFHLDRFDSAGSYSDTVHITGYPFDLQDIKGGSLWDKSSTKGDIKSRKDFLTYGIPTRKGDSGAPIWMKQNDKYYALGVHNSGFSGCNGGSKINDDFVKYLNENAFKNSPLTPYHKMGLAKSPGEEIKLYRVLNQDLNLSKPMSFLTFPGFINLEQPDVPLTREEGKDGFFVDSQFFLKFPVWEKRYFENDNIRNNRIRGFFGYSRLYIDYGFSSRVARNVESSPSLPITNRYGVRWDKVLTFNHRENEEPNSKWKSVNVLWTGGVADSYSLYSKNVAYEFSYFTAYLHHYSNGGTEGVFLAPNRNDYVNGDHSTSFWRLSYGRQWHDGMKQHMAMEVGFQHELGDTTTFFSFPIEQEKRYGRNRLIANAQYLRGLNSGLIEYLKIRTDIEYILDKDLSDFPYENKYRLGSHLYLDAPLRGTPGVGILAHFYIGRDYLNVRYDNPVFTAQIGLSLSINRYSLNILERPTLSE